MKRILLSILAIFFPWTIILFDGQPIGAIGALALQLTLIGWIPASIWAWKVAQRLSEPVTVIAPIIETPTETALVIPVSAETMPDKVKPAKKPKTIPKAVPKKRPPKKKDV